MRTFQYLNVIKVEFLLEKLDTNSFVIRLDDEAGIQAHNKQLYFPFGRSESKAKDLIPVELDTNDKETDDFPGCDIVGRNGQNIEYHDNDQMSKVSEET
jgi:hypothetical protein